MRSPKLRSVAAARSARRTRWFHRLLALVISVVVLAASFSALVWWGTSLFFSLDQAQTLVLIGPESGGRTASISVLFISPQPARSRLFLLTHPWNVQVLGGYGEYDLTALPGLLNLEKMTPETVRATWSHALGVPITQVVQITQSLPASVSEKATLERSVWQSLSSRSSWSQRWFLLHLFGSLRSTPTQQFSVNEVNDRDEWRTQLSRTPPLLTETQDRCSIAVVNTTPLSGLANRVGSVLEAAQLLVVRVTDDTPIQTQTQVWYRRDSDCAPILSSVLATLPVAVNPVSADTPELQERLDYYRAHLVISLGSDVATLMKEHAP